MLTAMRQRLRSARSRWRRRALATPARVRCGARRLERRLDPRERELLERVDKRIHFTDAMYLGDVEHYFAVGLSALACIEAALDSEPKLVLDVACGHGRVLRWLAARYPRASLTACDVDADGVAFCSRELGADGLVAPVRPAELELPRRYDLIWCGSLLTHLDAADGEALIERLSSALAPGGTLVLTTVGDHGAERMRGGETYHLPPERARAVVAAYERDGFGYADYGGHERWGVTLTSPAWVRARAHGLEEVWFGERAWDAHQDVLAFRVR